MSFKIVIEANRLPSIALSLRREAGGNAYKAALMAETSMKVEMNKPKHGRTYLRRGRQHVSSAPGEAPAVDMGQLQASIQTERVSDVAASVSTNNEHAEELEFGTSKMAARPFFGPAVTKAGKWFLRQMPKLK